MTTVAQILDERRGIAPGFDFLRIALALTILFTHSNDIVTGTWSEYEAGFWQVPVRALVPMFFVLSGFLISGSAQRLRLGDFIINRAMRIVPALLVDIFIAACVIGPIFTTLPIREYFKDPMFWHYFTNVAGIINYTLPGVFASNVNPNTVNGSLWTVPFEIGCYLIMSLVIISGLLKRRGALAAVSLAGCVAVLAIAVAARHSGSDTVNDNGSGATSILANFTSAKHGYYLYFYFVAGIMAFVYREQIPISAYLVAASAVIIFCISLSGVWYSGLLISKMVVCIPFLTYITLYIGMSSIPKLPLYSRGDYSYGVYLYGFPLQQALVATFPGMFSVVTHFVASAAAATAFAIFSWHCIEKPILRLRRNFSFTARKTEESEQKLPDAEPGSILNPEEPSLSAASPAMRSQVYIAQRQAEQRD